MRRAMLLLALASNPIVSAAQTVGVQQPAGTVQPSTAPAPTSVGTPTPPSTQVVLPNGTTITRSCESRQMEGVSIRTLDSRSVGSLGISYLERLRLTMARRLWLATVEPRYAVFSAMLMSDGAVTHVTQVGRSEDLNFNAAALSAVTILATDPFALPVPLAMPDSLPLLVTFGYHADGTGFLETHTACASAAYPDNPPPAYPKDMLDSRRDGWAVAKFVVDTAGRVDTATIKMLDWTDDAIPPVIVDALRAWRFVPAEIDGARMPDVVERRMEFRPPPLPETITSRPPQRVDSTEAPAAIAPPAPAAAPAAPAPATPATSPTTAPKTPAAPAAPAAPKTPPATTAPATSTAKTPPTNIYY